MSSRVSVRTLSGTAKEDEDFRKLDKTIRFKKDQESTKVTITIMDNDDWEPDEEFFIELYDPKTGYSLQGKDCKCAITIVDDDNPGLLSFEKNEVKVLATEKQVLVNIIRKNGSKGTISCKYKTLDLETHKNRAVDGKDYEATKGFIEFKNSETSQTVSIKLFSKRHLSPDECGLMFGL